MRISPTGAAAANFSAAQAELEGSALDNVALGIAASNALAALAGTHSSGSQRYAQLVEMPPATHKDALGRVPVMAGLVLLVPRSTASNTLKFLNPETGAITDGPVMTGEQTATTQFRCAVRLPSGKILMVPAVNAKFWEYDPWTNTVAATVTHGRTSTGSVPAFGGACVGKDGKVYLTPGHSADKAICIYDPIALTLTVTAHTLPFNADWQTSDPGGPAVPLPDGNILFLSRRGVALSAPWHYNVATGAVTNATVTTTTTNSIQYAGVLSKDGKRVLIIAGLTNKIQIYDIATKTLFDSSIFASSFTETNPYFSATMLQDGRVAFLGNGYRNIAIFDPETQTLVKDLADWSGLGVGGTLSSSANIVGGVQLSSGKVLLLPSSNLTGFITWKPWASGGVPDGVRYSRYYDKF